MHSGYPMFAAGASDQPPNSCQDGPGRGPVGWDRPLMAFFVSDARRTFLLTVCLKNAACGMGEWGWVSVEG